LSFLPIAPSFPARHLPACAWAGLPVDRAEARAPTVMATSTGNRRLRTIVLRSLRASADRASVDLEADMRPRLLGRLLHVRQVQARSKGAISAGSAGQFCAARHTSGARLLRQPIGMRRSELVSSERCV